MVRETSPGSQENAANVIVLDDVSPRYVKATAALKACDANLGIALHSLLDSRTPRRGTSGYGEVPLSCGARDVLRDRSSRAIGPLPQRRPGVQHATGAPADRDSATR
jgi:hypothetical protein